MKLAYFDLIGGANGDIILGALLDAGLSLGTLRERLAGLDISEWSVESERVLRRGIYATRSVVRVEESSPGRTFGEILSILLQSELAPNILTSSVEIMRRLAEVEARIHNTSVEEVHLHELGGVDTIVDVVGAVTGLRQMGIEQVQCSSFPLAEGMIETRHGNFPLPAPATAALLEAVRAPIGAVTGTVETVTPTAAAILTTLATSYGVLPEMHLEKVGYGGGAALRTLRARRRPYARANEKEPPRHSDASAVPAG